MNKKRIVTEISALIDFQEKTFKEIETKEDEMERFLEQYHHAAKEWSAVMAAYPRRYKGIFASFFKSRQYKALVYNTLLLEITNLRRAIAKFTEEYEAYSKEMIGFLSGQAEILKECEAQQFSPQSVKAVKVNLHMRLPKNQSRLNELAEAFLLLKKRKEDIDGQIAEMRTEQG